VPARWTAVSALPWLRLLRATGITGVDTLDMEIDPTLLSSTDFVTAGTIDVSIDTPGTLSLPFSVGVRDTRPSFQRGTAALVGNRGRIYIDGVIRTDSAAIDPGILHVTGAVLQQARYLTDTRFIGDVSVLAVDVTGAVAGQPIVVRALGPLVDTALTTAVEAPTRVPTGYLSLPYGAYRPPQYAPTLDALYFAGSGTVYRWAHDASSWTLTQVAVPAALDRGGARGPILRLQGGTPTGRGPGGQPPVYPVRRRQTSGGAVRRRRRRCSCRRRVSTISRR
jgi:hypothetical protein